MLQELSNACHWMHCAALAWGLRSASGNHCCGLWKSWQGKACLEPALRGIVLQGECNVGPSSFSVPRMLHMPGSAGSAQTGSRSNMAHPAIVTRFPWTEQANLFGHQTDMPAQPAGRQQPPSWPHEHISQHLGNGGLPAEGDHLLCLRTLSCILPHQLVQS